MKNCSKLSSKTASSRLDLADQSPKTALSTPHPTREMAQKKQDRVSYLEANFGMKGALFVKLGPDPLSC